MRYGLLLLGALIVFRPGSGDGDGGPPTAATEIPTSGGHGSTLLGALLVVGLVVLAMKGAGQVRSRSATAHVHGGRRKTVIKHEALGHAAIAHGVGAGNIRARLKPGGGGEVTCDTSRMSPAEYVAFMRAGRAVAGASGDCLGDEASAKQELDCLPADQRAGVSREADRIIRRHAGSSFGQKVARALDRDGRF